jgi:hypothetical protein
MDCHGDSFTFYRRNWNSEFGEKFKGGKIAMVWPCKNNGQSKDTKGSIIIEVGRREMQE